MLVDISEFIEDFVDSTLERYHNAMASAVEDYLSFAAQNYEPDYTLRKVFGDFCDENILAQETDDTPTDISLSELEDKFTEFCHTRGIDLVDSDSWKEQWGTRWLLFVKELYRRGIFFHFEGSVRIVDGCEQTSTEIFFHDIGYTEAGELL